MSAKGFNRLSLAEAERLALLLEELGECAQAIGKVLRHGYRSFNPIRVDLGDNRDQLEKEIGDVMAAVKLLTRAKDLSSNNIRLRQESKLYGLDKGQYLHHQPIKSIP